MNRTDAETFLKSHAFVGILAAVGFLIIAVAVFEAGVFVGFHKASFAYHWEENYERNFGPAPGPFHLGDGSAPNPHGVMGRIVSVALPSIVVAGPDENERTVAVGTTTIIREGNRSVGQEAIAVGQDAVVIGEPDEKGVVEATFIRLMPSSANAPAGGNPF